MNENELINESIEETGTEVVDAFAQNIPGTAPSFDTIDTEDINKIEPKVIVKKHKPDEDAYKATAINNTLYDEDKS